jgi:uncharacterized protein YbjT (DUF2867 family)
MSKLILVTGATGHIGKRVAELLAEQGYSLRLMVRDPGKAPDLAGSQLVIADYSDPQTLVTAFADVDAALVVSVYGKPGQRALLHKNAFEAAAQAQVKHIVYTSFQGAAPTSKFPYARDHHQSEQYLKETGIAYTVLRNNLYLDGIAHFFDEHGVARMPIKHGALAFVTREDVARVAAASLHKPGSSPAAYDVTGPEALTGEELVGRLSALVGRELRFKSETMEEGRKWRSQLGAPDWEVDIWLGNYAAIEAGELEQTSDTVFQLTGRQPYRLETYFEKYPHLLQRLRKLQ